MVRILHELSQIGSTSLHFFWLPLFIWTLFSFLIVISLRKFEKLHPAYHYNIRIALIMSLPIGFISWSLFAHFLTPSKVVDQVLPQHLFVLLNPVTVGQKSLDTSTIHLFDPELWLGIGFTFIALMGLISLLKLFKDYFELHRFKKKLNLIPIQNLKQLNVSTRTLFTSTSQKINVAYLSQPQIPFTFGWFNPVIVLPDFIKKEPDKLNLTLLHELTHIKRHDYALNGFMKMTDRLFLFHPLIHVITKEINEYNELSCDFEVITDEQISPKKYAYLLYELMHLPVIYHSTGLSMANSSSNIKKRIQAMTEFKPKRRSAFLQGVLFLSVFLVMITLMACSGLQNQDTSGKNLVDQKMTFTSPAISINGNQVMSSKMGSKFEGQALGITYIETSKYGTFLISGQSFDGAKPVGRISGNTLTFKINRMNVHVKSLSNILPSKNATVWVKNNANISNKKSFLMGWAKNLDQFHQIASAQSLSGPNYTVKNGHKIYVVTDKMPELIGGLKSVQSRIQYPEKAKKAGIQGRVYVQFIVNKEGNVVNPHVIRGIGGGCNKEALKAVEQARFKPGYKDGKPVQVRYALPIVFSLKNQVLN